MVVRVTVHLNAASGLTLSIQNEDHVKIPVSYDNARFADTMTLHFTIKTDDGLIQPAKQCPSPNCDERPGDVVPTLVVIHGISLPPGEFGGDEIEAFFCNALDCSAHPFFEEIRDLRVSSHLLLRRNGSVVQFVPFHMRAWHAGESQFRGVRQCNDFSLGIELEGDDETLYAAEQYEALAAVLRALFGAYPGLSLRRVAGHCDVSPGRKTDPGPVFDWLRLYDGVKAAS